MARSFLGCLMLLLAGAGACQHAAVETPAMLSDDDADNLDLLKTALADAVGRASVALGGGDPTTSSTVSVLPPRVTAMEGRSPAMPELFDLVLRDGTCFAVHRSTGDAYDLGSVRCRPA